MKYLSFVALLVIPEFGMSQTFSRDTAFLAAANARKFQLYDQVIGGQSRLYNGTEYKDYLSRDEEHPYFGIDDWQPGDVVYDDEFFTPVELFYDISRDQIITEHKLSGGKIEMIAKKVSRFTIGDHKFVRLHPDQGGVIREGFYEVLFDRNIKAYARHEKQMQTKAENYTMIYSFTEKHRFYLLKDGAYHPVRSKRSVMNILEDHKPELRAFLKEQNIRFRDNREKAIARLAEEYDRQKR